MKIFSAKQIYAADEFTIAEQQISSDMLIERAAQQVFEWMHQRLQGTQVVIHVFCGIGNNGGDGLALARLLTENGYQIKVYVVNYSEKRSADFLTNLARLKERKIWPEFLQSDKSLPTIEGEAIIVDAIFGIGLNRPPDAWVGNLIKHLNESRAFVLSIDIPSGLATEAVPKNTAHVVNADFVLSFQAPKLPFFLPETGVFVNQWGVLDIGLSRQYLGTTETTYQLLGRREVLRLYRPRLKYTHKGTYGHSLLVGGSHGKIGAVHLAAKACITAGSGLVSCMVPKCGYLPLQTALPEVMVTTDASETHITSIGFPQKTTAVGLGVGMGTDKATVKAMQLFLEAYEGPLVIDADGLNILSQNGELLAMLPPETILTPHAKELERLIGTWKDDFDKLEKAKMFAEKHQVVLVLKGAHTITFFKGKGYINTTGNPGMATAGSGDVLTGIITALLSQGYAALEAAVMAVYLHGSSGDLVATQHGFEAVTASHLIETMGRAFVTMLNGPKAEVPKQPVEHGN